MLKILSQTRVCYHRRARRVGDPEENEKARRREENLAVALSVLAVAVVEIVVLDEEVHVEGLEEGADEWIGHVGPDARVPRSLDEDHEYNGDPVLLEGGLNQERGEERAEEDLDELLDIVGQDGEEDGRCRVAW